MRLVKFFILTVALEYSVIDCVRELKTNGFDRNVWIHKQCIRTDIALEEGEDGGRKLCYSCWKTPFPATSAAVSGV